METGQTDAQITRYYESSVRYINAYICRHLCVCVYTYTQYTNRQSQGLNIHSL